MKQKKTRYTKKRTGKTSKHSSRKVKQFKKQKYTQSPDISNDAILNTTLALTPDRLSYKSICAPFIEPLNLSKGQGLSNANINIIKSATDESCFTIEALRNIANKWNETNPNMKIEYNDTTSGKTLWSSINNVMSSKCNNEVCWIKQDFIKDSSLSKDLLKNFKPLMPKKWHDKPNEWLNTIDIRDVMNQYETKFPEFEFIGPVPMDFDSKVGFGQCVIDELCKISLKSLIDKGKAKIGVIFNLDKHNESGSHWVAMHCGIDNNGNGGNDGNSSNSRNGSIYYWDSYGMKPNSEVVVLMNKLKTQGTELGYNMQIKLNNVRHQYKNSECGVYCLYFLTSLLEGKSFNEIIKNIISDDKMNAKRKDFFAKVDS